MAFASLCFACARGLLAGLVWCSFEATVVALSGRIAPRGGVMVGELVASSAALRFAGGWLFGVLLKQLAFLSLAALQARRVMVGKCVAGYAALDLRAVEPSVHCCGTKRENGMVGIQGSGKQNLTMHSSRRRIALVVLPGHNAGAA